MASLEELRTLFGNGDMLRKVEAAIVIAAQSLLDGATPTSAEKAWADVVLDNPLREAQKAWKYMLAFNAGSTVVVITGANDTSIQNNVNAVVPLLVDAMAGV